jgi:hypothetical protein
MSILDKLRPARSESTPLASIPPRPTDAPQSDTDLPLVRMTLGHRRTIGGPRGYGTLSDGDEVILPREDAAYFVEGGLAMLLGWLPDPNADGKPIDGPALTVHIGLHRADRSAHLGREPQPGELVTLPAAEARGYVRAGVATFDATSSRAELTDALTALDGTPAVSRRVVVALDDVLRAAGVFLPLEAPTDVPR